MIVIQGTHYYHLSSAYSFIHMDKLYVNENKIPIHHIIKYTCKGFIILKNNYDA